MAGQIPGFDPDEFRRGLRFAMQVGAPPDVDQRATFVFPAAETASGPAGPDHVPFGPDVRITAIPRRTVQVPCAVEYQGTSGPDDNSVGRFAINRVVLTLLDQDYELVKGFEFVVIGGVRYQYERQLPPSGLGPVGIHQLQVWTEADA